MRWREETRESICHRVTMITKSEIRSGKGARRKRGSRYAEHGSARYFRGSAAKSICFRCTKARYVTDGSNLEPICNDGKRKGDIGKRNLRENLRLTNDSCTKVQRVRKRRLCTARARGGNEGVDMPSTARLDIFAEISAKSICFRDTKARYVTDGSIFEPICNDGKQKGSQLFGADFLFVYHSQGTWGVSPAEAVIISCAAVISIEGA